MSSGIAIRRAITVLVLLLLNGCYGSKMVKMPINAELTFKRLDTLQTRQNMILKEIRSLSEALAEEKEARARGNASTDSRLSEIEEAIGILSSKLDDSLQLMSAGQASKPLLPPKLKPVFIDTAAAVSGDTSMSNVSPKDTSLAQIISTGNDEEEKLYKASYMDLTLGNYDLAVQEFKNYLVRYPGGAHLSEVHYYLGECYYATDKYMEAIGEYQFVIKEFPRSRLVPSAYLKSGLCYTKLEETSLAEQYFRELISKFPHSEEAEHARAALKEIGG